MRLTNSAPSRRRLIALALAGCGAVTGCGAKTGLEVPDVERAMDAAQDARGDAICIEPNPDVVEPLIVNLSTEAQVASADVLFVIDRTGSMDGEIENIRQGLRTVIVPALSRAIPDLQLGLAHYGDFPIEPYGSPPDELPFTLAQRMTRDVTSVQGSLNRLRAGLGGDNPEAMVEALYQIATGEGLGRFIERSGGCPSVGAGYACFRPRAQPIVILIADAPSHNGPPRAGDPTGHGYDARLFAPDPRPHVYADAVAALNRVHARVIGISSGLSPFSGRQDLERLAIDTGSVGENGRPLVFDISADGTGLNESVVNAVQRFTAEVRFDVSARAVDPDGSGGAALVRRVFPQRATPMGQITRLDATTFYSVLPGTQLQFGIEVDPALAVPMDVEQRFTVRIEFLADGRPTLGARDVELVIPARNIRCVP